MPAGGMAMNPLRAAIGNSARSSGAGGTAMKPVPSALAGWAGVSRSEDTGCVHSEWRKRSSFSGRVNVTVRIGQATKVHRRCRQVR